MARRKTSKATRDLRRKHPLKNRRESVFECAHYELDQDDLSGCGESWSWCHCGDSGRSFCDCKYIYAQQFCPFYKRGNLRGRWEISEMEHESVNEFLKSFRR